MEILRSMLHGFLPFPLVSVTELCLFWYSLRADEIKLWLTPSAKQRRNPCSGLPAVYPDLSTHHDWPVKKDLCFVCRKTDNSQTG